MIEQFAIQENGFNQIRKKILRNSILFGSIAIFAGLFISIYNSYGQESQVNTVLLVAPIIIAAFCYGIFKAIRNQKELFSSFRLLIDADKITREQALTPTISIPISEIREIIKSAKGGFIIKGKSTQDIIIVPPQIDNPEKLESRLSSLIDLTFKGNKSFAQKYPWLFPPLMIILMIVVYVSNNKILVGISGTILTFGLIYSLVVTQRSKHVDKRTKTSMWLVLVALFSIIAITLAKLIS